MALAADGSIDVWGDNGQNQITNAPTDNGYVDIHAGWDHGLALRADGSIVAWGDADGYSGGGGTPTDAGYVQIASGSYFSLALTPEPGTICLLSLGVVGLLRRRRNA